MKKKLLYLLTMIFVLGLNSCSKDDDTESSYDQGKAKGVEFIASYTAYGAADDSTLGTLTKATEGLKMYTAYQDYKNSTDTEYKAGFVAGAGLSSESMNAISNISTTAGDYVSLYTQISAILAPAPVAE